MDYKKYILFILLAANALIFLALYDRRPGNLKVYFLDVGQGDAIFFETPNKKQVLIDGGRNKKIISLLGSIMPFGDKSIDVVIATHPDADHIGGLPEVFARYKVDLLLEPGVESDNSFDDELHRRASSTLARRGQVINFGDGAKLIILFPNQDVSDWETNDASIVARLDYGESSFLFTGDSPIQSENILISLNKGILDVDVLKAGHHGSRNSTSLMHAEAVSPEYAIISAGKNNTYGHPHQEVLNILQKVGSKILSTIDLGTIEFESDGKNLNIK